MPALVQLLHQREQLVLRGAGGVVGVPSVELGRQLLKRHLAGFQVLKQGLRRGYGYSCGATCPLTSRQ